MDVYTTCHLYCSDKRAVLCKACNFQVWQQCPHGMLQCLGGNGDSGAAARAVLQASCPMFEAFWQGRLIPGARIDSLPFVEVTRCWGALAMHDAHSMLKACQTTTARLHFSSCMHCNSRGLDSLRFA